MRVLCSSPLGRFYTKKYILCFQSGDWIQLKILEVEPELTKLGATLAEALELQAAHDNVLLQLQVNILYTACFILHLNKFNLKANNIILLLFVEASKMNLFREIKFFKV